MDEIKLKPCQVCGGSKSINLPLRNQLSIQSIRSEAVELKVVDTNRRYPCPECSSKVAEENVQFVGARDEIDQRYANDDDAYKHAKRQVAFQMVEYLLGNNLIEFARGEVDEHTLTRPITAKIGVVSRYMIATMEERVSARQLEKAEQLLRSASAEVRVWGSHYTGDEGNISKGQAIEAIQRAFNTLKAQNLTRTEAE